MNDFSGCYVVLDRDMEELIFDTMVFSTYEKALKYVQNAIKDGQNLYDRVFQDDKNSWIMQNDGEQSRIIEISNKAIW
ncbi:hypothetical protein [Limosilactobacillus reuteri]|uniref:hypothetical protein n=1 Tax=Limosilactobacillus reuteri TaxID=1598 RepID=UPI000A2E71CD|nr:hypothetical protein [Limosilactobacillus reuteri]OTA54576.1 hypothetical protein BHL93_02800 [Limosilactobacillus reuteri]